MLCEKNAGVRKEQEGGGAREGRLQKVGRTLKR
jgi:hypothetical protein